MNKLKAYATRKNGVISVTVTGRLPNSCYSAKIVDKYPGGNRTYSKDPGSAQVFIEEIVKPDSEICPMVLVPWISHVNIIDNYHNKVTIFINDKPQLEIDVNKEPNKFRVIALTVSESDKYEGCSIIPADSVYPSIYSSVFGPAAKSECEKWIEENCMKNPGIS